MDLLRWAEYVAFAMTYGWSTKTFHARRPRAASAPPEGLSRFEGSEFLRHAEVGTEHGWLSRVMDSGVCRLGKVSFFLMAAVLGISIVMRDRIHGATRAVLWLVFAAWLAAMAFMNFPMFVRSIPSAMFAALIIHEPSRLP